MAKLIPLILALLGLGAGVGAGFALRPEPAAPDAAEAAARPAAEGTSEFVRLNNQFVIPVVQDGRVRAMVILSLSLEMRQGGGAAVFSLEPKLRDAFLQVLFDHANAGGFSGAFTGASAMATLREALRETGRSVLGPDLREVLIIDMVRQDS